MLMDLELLRSFVSVVDSGGFTRAGERVHRTQSTVSQQIRKLEDSVGRPLLVRHAAGRGVTPTEDGERLLGYARRLILLADEARDMMRHPEPPSLVRLGVPEDFAARRLTELLSGFARAHPHIRLDTVSGLCADLRRLMALGELDLALAKREPGDGPSLAAWPEPLFWVAGLDSGPILDPVPLILFPQGCLYRARAIHALETAGRRWRIAYASHSLVGIQAALSSGLGVSILSEAALQPDHRVLGPADGFAPVPPTEMALLPGPGPLGPAVRLLGAHLRGALSPGAPPVPDAVAAVS